MLGAAGTIGALGGLVLVDGLAELATANAYGRPGGPTSLPTPVFASPR